MTLSSMICFNALNSFLLNSSFSFELAQTTYYMVNLSSVLKSIENPVSVSSVLCCLNLFDSLYYGWRTDKWRIKFMLVLSFAPFYHWLPKISEFELHEFHALFQIDHFLFPFFNHDNLLKNLLAFERRNLSFSMKRWSLSVCCFY